MKSFPGQPLLLPEVGFGGFTDASIPTGVLFILTGEVKRSANKNNL